MHAVHEGVLEKERHRQKKSEREWTDLDGFSTHQLLVRHANEGVLDILWDMFEAPVLLVIVGVMSALVSYCCSLLVEYGNSWRYGLLGNSSDYFMWAKYCIWCLVFSLLACLVTNLTCKEAAGSGLPEMKAILGGVLKPVLLSIRLIVAKLSGLVLSLIAGLSVGKEGPFVQISGAIADQLMRLPMFRHIRIQDAKRLEIIACACASGVGATFGTAFGGVFFSIELTSSAYLVRTVPKAFLASVCAMLVIFFLRVSDQLALFDERLETMSTKSTWQEVAVFVLIGIVTGLLGVLFVTIVESISAIRNEYLDASKLSWAVVTRRRYLWVAVVSLAVSFPMYYELTMFPDAVGGSKFLLERLFQATDMSSLTWKMIPFFVYKFAATTVSVTLPLPVGLFTPVFLCGGIFGRIVGEHLQSFRVFSNFAPWEYSVLGAAGFATGVTRAISTAIIVYELCGQPHMRMPLSIVVLTAYFVGNRFSKNVYDVLIDTNGTPYMQEIPKALYSVPVSKVMVPINRQQVLALDSTYKDADSLLSRFASLEAQPPSMNSTSEFSPLTKSSSDEYLASSYQMDGLGASTDSDNFEMMWLRSTSIIPVVKSKKSMVIVGAVQRDDVYEAIIKLKAIMSVAQQTPITLGGGDEGELVSLSVDTSSDRQTDTVSAMMNENIQFVVLVEGGKSIVPVASPGVKNRSRTWKPLSVAMLLDPSPYQVVDTMHLSKVELLFRMLSLSQAYVTQSGKLVGIVTRKTLRDFLGQHRRRPMDKCTQLKTAILSSCFSSQALSETDSSTIDMV